MQPSITTWPHLMMISWAILIATSFPAAALIANTSDATSLTALRFLVASILFMPILLYHGDISFPRPVEFLSYTIISATSVFYFWALFKSLQTTTPLHTGAIFTLIPAMTVAISYIISREKTSNTMLSAIFIGCIGSIWVVSKGTPTTLMNLDFNSGDTLFFIGCAVLSLYSPLIIFFKKRLNIIRSPVYITFWILVIGTILLTSVALYENNGDLEWHKLAYDDYLVILYLAVFTTVITFWQLQYCTPILGSVVVMSYTYLIPSLALLLEIVFFSYNTPISIYIGVIMTLVSLAILNRPIKPNMLIKHQ